MIAHCFACGLFSVTLSHEEPHTLTGTISKCPLGSTRANRRTRTSDAQSPAFPWNHRLVAGVEAALDAGATQADIARRVECGRSTISMFASGQKTPQLWRERVAFERELGIPGPSWDAPPNVTRVNVGGSINLESPLDAA